MPTPPPCRLPTAHRALLECPVLHPSRFDKFDEDRSGAVSTYEMTKMVNELGLELGPAEIGNLMKEADPDGSGQIDFDEFVSVMQGQMAKGDGGGLANIVSAAGNLFGWVNPLSWFGGK